MVGSSKDEEALIAAEAAYGAEAEDAEEPIPDRTVGVAKGFGVAGWADLSIRKHGNLSSGMCPKFRFGVSYVERIRIICFWFGPNLGMRGFLLFCL